MGTTPTPNLTLIKSNPFEEEDTWGALLNGNWDKVDALGTVSAKAIAAVTPAADRLAYFTSGTAAAVTAFTAFARSLLDDADAATMRATLGLGGLATLSSVDLTTQVSGILPIANGGTGASTAAAARTSLGAAATVHTHVVSDVTGLQTALDGKQASGSYVTPTDLSTALSPYATTSYVSSALSPYATTSYVNSAVAGVTSATTANVLSATAGASVGAVGTYGYLRISPATTLNPGSTTAGSNLIYGNSGGGGGPTPAGTWQLMGYTSNASLEHSVSLWLRIS